MHVFRTCLGKAATILLVAALSVCAFWEWAFPHIFRFDESALDADFPATVFHDCHGNALHIETGADYAIRIPVALENLPKHLIDVTLAAEDRRFFEHDGVDLCAVLRAGAQLVAGGKIVSGASTVTMQLVALVDGRERSFVRKFVQMGKARNLELRWSKQKILEEYFNRLPYGGKIYGIEAAAQYYFGRPASELNLAESVLLAGIPQRPNRYRPDRSLESALKRRERVLQMLVRQGVFSPEKADAIRREPLRLRDFSTEIFPRAEDPQFFLWAREQAPEVRGKCITTLDTKIQEVTRATVRGMLRERSFVNDGAAIVVENKTRAVRAFLGTADFRKPGDGQVNAATAWRSPGSLLKPFIFGEAVNGGLLVAETVLEDVPLAGRDYRPGNFSGTFAGEVTAQTALSRSLNTTAVRVLAELGTERICETLENFGFKFLSSQNAESLGLSLAIGGSSTTLCQIAEAYVALANGSVPAPLRVFENAEPCAKSAPVWSTGSAEMVLRMLRSGNLAEAENLEAAWKTGTSNGLRDAWCVAVTPEWTVAVWFGNKDGSSAPELVGAEIAAPAAGKILSALYRGSVPAPWGEIPQAIPSRLCAKSGLAAGNFCAETREGTTLAGIPLQRCLRCKSETAKRDLEKKTQILGPQGGVYRRGYDGKTRVVLQSVPARAHWYLDGKYIGFFNSGTPLELSPGKHTLIAWGGENFSSDRLFLEVK